MARIHRVAGPPGTGKTTYVDRQCARAIDKHGPQGVIVCSLTRAAAREAAGRVSPDITVGTLHSVCYRMLGRPDLIDRDTLEEWNLLQRGESEYEMSMKIMGDKDRGTDYGITSRGELYGDELHSKTGLALHRMMPVPSVQFHERWTEFKRDRGVIDFDDMIALAHSELPLPPKDSKVIFVDEAQDLSKLETSILSRWSESLESVIFTGDQDQALFGWRGASRESMAGPYHTVLSQSYRVPRAPWRVATAITDLIDTRDPADYEPRDAEGTVERSDDKGRPACTYKNIEPLIPDIEEEITADRSVMIIASCQYMLRPIMAALRSEVIPFYGLSEPLHLHSGGTARAVLDYAAACRRGNYTVSEIQNVAKVLRATGVFKRGGKKRIQDMSEDASTGEIELLLRDVVEDNAVGPLVFDEDLDWLVEHATSERKMPLEFACRVYAKWGKIQPRVEVNTIHGAKGHEADLVIVAPDLSYSGWLQMQKHGWHGVDSTHRLFYVAVTRTRDRLLRLAADSHELSYEWPL